MSETKLNRRAFLARSAAIGSTAVLAGCDALSQSPTMRGLFRTGEAATRSAQRLILTPNDLAREYSESEITPNFKANGSINPRDPEYLALVRSNFTEWRLGVVGLVERPISISLPELRALPSRTQITRHDCVEGWSAVGKWKGVQLSTLLQSASLKPEARYAVLHCADTLSGEKYYESIDLIDAFHPQTILAYDMNDAPLTVPHGAPLRLRVERQLGYKMAKYVMQVEIVSSFATIRRGRGGFWEDRGYEWYAGI